MKQIVFSSFLLLLALVPAFAQQAPQKKPQSPKSSIQQKIEVYVKKLAADEYDIREEATSDLLKLGRSAAAHLRKQLETTKDPEVRNRLQFILKQFGELPAPKTQPRPKVKEGQAPVGRQLPAPNLGEIFKEFAMPEEFRKLFDGLQKEFSEELQQSMKDMLNPNNRNSKPGKPRIRMWNWTFPPQKGQGRTPFRDMLRTSNPCVHPSGLKATLLSPALRTHLRLEKDDIGILVTEVKARSWAENCGLRRHDVILRVEGTTSVTSLDDLDGFADKSLSVTIIRRGELMSKTLPKFEHPTTKKPQKDL